MLMKCNQLSDNYYYDSLHYNTDSFSVNIEFIVIICYYYYVMYLDWLCASVEYCYCVRMRILSNQSKMICYAIFKILKFMPTVILLYYILVIISGKSDVFR